MTMVSVVLLIAALPVAGCSGGSTDATITGANGDGTNGNGTVDPTTLKLETEVIGEARAGLPFVVKCRTFKPVVADDINQGYGAEVPLPGAATVTIISGPGLPVTIAGTTVTMAKSGIYEVACQVPSYKLVDPTPADLIVEAGIAVAIDTKLLPPTGSPAGTPAPTDVLANTPVPVTCTAEDKYGNELVDGFTVQVAPSDAPQPQAYIVQFKKAQDYQIACVVDGQADLTPALLHVHADVPVHLFAILDPPEIGAGGASAVTCVANDAYGNPIADFPFAIDFSGDPDIQLKGLYVTSTKAGAHKVACVPETGDWSLYQLHPASLLVDPGPPAVLIVQTVPAKQVYADDDTVQFLSVVKDAYDNVIPSATVSLAVTDPATGWKVKDAQHVLFLVDGKYSVHLQVDQAPDISKDVLIIVDGTPPELAITYPNWGDTITGKPSVQVLGTTADDTSGIASLVLTPNWDDADKKQPVIGAQDPDTLLNAWASQVPAKHGLNAVKVDATDLGGQTTSATRGYYYSGQYYPTDGAHPKDAPVVDGIQIYLGKDFIDDGVHDYNDPNDLATIIEMALAGMDLNALLPPNMSQGGIDITVSNVTIQKPLVSLEPVDGGIKMHIWINNFSADVAVKAKVGVGPISVTVSVSGNITMSQIEVSTQLAVDVSPLGGPTVKVVSTLVALKDFQLHLNGLASLLDSIADAIIKGYIGTIETAMTNLLNQQIPPLLLGILNSFAINQAVPLPALLPGMPATTLTLNSWLTTLTFTANGVLVKLNAELSAPKGTAHVNLGSIGRQAGCPGEAGDVFQIDTNQRMQIALHDDIINQALQAVWYGGALKLDGITAAQLGLSGAGASIGGFDLSTATFDVDLFLAPIIESCAQPTSMDMRVQAGDVYLKANLALGDQPLSIGIFANADLPASIAMAKDPTSGVQELSVSIDTTKLNLMMEIIDITPGFESAKDAFQSILQAQVTAQLAKPIPGLSNISLPLPAIDLSSLIPGLAPGLKLQLVLKDLVRAGGYSAIDAEIN